MISKGLLSEVLYVNATKINVSATSVSYFVEEDFLEDSWYGINIYELAHKVKEWAIENGIVLESSTNKSKAICHTGTRTHNNEIYYPEIFVSITEPEAIFKAGQWILENKDV